MNKNFSLVKMITLKTMVLLVFISFFSQAQISNAAEIPKIISRLQWGTDESKMIWPIKNAKVQKFVIHHTASTNLVSDSDGSGEYKNMVNNIYNYHSSKKSWYEDGEKYIGFGDIGYNYLIDPNGNIYEGRSGGNGSVAGHVSGFNTGSIGISVLGRYQDYVDSENNFVSSHVVNSAIKQSLTNLAGWLAANNNISLNSRTNFNGKYIDGLVGHGELTPTICPGDELEKELNIIQKNASIIEKTYSNYAYQINGDESVYIISDGYKIRFESRQKLPNVYKNRTIKQISKSQLSAYKYKDLVVYSDGSLLQEFNENTVYFLQNGKKRAMEMSGEEFAKMGFKGDDIIKVFSSDLKIYQSGLNIKYSPDGKLINDKKGTVYLAENGKKRKFTSATLFEYLNYKWKNIVDDNFTNYYLDGDYIIYPDGILVKSVNNDKVYLTENKKKKEISSGTLLQVLGYKAENVISINQDELDNFAIGDKLNYPDNTLVKAEDYSAVYIIQGAKRKEFTSAVLFEKSGYDWNSVIEIDKKELDTYPRNGRALYPDGLLIKSTDNPNVYLLESGKKRKITSADLLKKIGYDWSDIISINPSEMKDYPDGKTMIYPDGTLVKRRGFPIIFKIENGQRKEFTSLALFEATNSNFSDVIFLDREEFLAYENGGNLLYPENTLLREIGSDGVYVMKNGKIQAIQSAEEFKLAGYKWSDVIEVLKEEMKLYKISVKVSSSPVTQKEKEIIQTVEPKKNIELENPEIKAGTGKEPNIKIAIYSVNDEDIKITANGNYTVNYYDSSGKISTSLQKDSNEETVISYFDSSNYVRFIPESRDVILQVLSYSDLSWNKETNDDKFRGEIEIKYSENSQKLWVINELLLEDYINGIAEALSDSPEEYLKAFGTIARTYAMYYIKRGGKHTDEPFHLKNSRNGNGNDQVYKGYNFELRASKIVDANEFTTGYVIDFNDKPIVAAYSSDSGGVTKSGCEVFKYCGADYIYLNGGIKDPTNTVHNQDKILISHGVGMSAVGAYQMARGGNSWEEIIEYYYKGVDIKKYY
ncbi:MAG: N-acetylmuramoyl-L-alanine amidase [Candidatus Pacebacteria bacterium]|nr:N-acetylmuramoyl-L-alanine amidase [Candidatus Paceibacterota bacterium]